MQIDKTSAPDNAEARLSKLEETVEDLRCRNAAPVGLAFDALGMLAKLAPVYTAKRLVYAQEELSRQRTLGVPHQLLAAAYRASWLQNATFPSDDTPPEARANAEAMN